MLIPYFFSFSTVFDVNILDVRIDFDVLFDSFRELLKGLIGCHIRDAFQLKPNLGLLFSTKSDAVGLPHLMFSNSF